MSFPFLQIRSVTPKERPRALDLLFAGFPQSERSERITATLDAVCSGRLSLDGLIWAWAGGTPVAAALWMPQPDGIALVWPPSMAAGETEAERIADALLASLTQTMDEAGVSLSQVLVDAWGGLEQARLQRHGYQERTELYFLGRSLTERLPEQISDPSLTEVRFSSGDHRARFASVLEATYRGTLDCPWMSGVRTGEQALDCHRQTGAHNPDLWRIFTWGGRDAAICLLAEHPHQDAVELVYFGVVPEFRGRGLGRWLLVDALHASAALGRAVMFLAVDAQNRYANAIYAELGFGELARRCALFRSRGGAAQK